jgi:hypothetical protein
VNVPVAPLGLQWRCSQRLRGQTHAWLMAAAAQKHRSLFAFSILPAPAASLCIQPCWRRTFLVFTRVASRQPATTTTANLIQWRRRQAVGCLQTFPQTQSVPLGLIGNTQLKVAYPGPIWLSTASPDFLDHCRCFFEPESRRVDGVVRADAHDPYQVAILRNNSLYQSAGWARIQNGSSFPKFGMGLSGPWP